MSPVVKATLSTLVSFAFVVIACLMHASEQFALIMLGIMFIATVWGMWYSVWSWRR